jgi:hypothetical protein
MESNQNQTKNQTDQAAAASTPSPKQCPFCNGLAVVTTCYEPIRYGVRCTACEVIFLPVLESEAEAVALWNRRCGTVSAAGGRATAGKCSRRKRASCRRNFRRAREQKKLKQIRARLNVVAPLLKSFWESELAELQAAAAANCAALRELEPVILADPLLRGLYEMLPSQKAPAASE